MNWYMHGMNITHMDGFVLFCRMDKKIYLHGRKHRKSQNAESEYRSFDVQESWHA